jgi:hypothetical protein
MVPRDDIEILFWIMLTGKLRAGKLATGKLATGKLGIGKLGIDKLRAGSLGHGFTQNRLMHAGANPNRR